MLKDTKIRRLQIHWRANDGHPEACKYSCLASLGMLADSVEEVVIGYLRDRERKKDEGAYHAIKEALRNVPKWTFPYKDEQYAD